MEMLQPQKGEEPGCGHMEVATTPGSAPSPQSDAVTNELQELSLHPAPNLPPLKERKNVLQLKLQQRRTREELVSQGIMPPLKSPAAFHEQRRSLERARTEDYLKRKIRSRPERSELVRMHILEETSAEPSLQAKQLQLKRARLADDLNDKISHRPGPIELVHKNILSVACPVHNELLDSPKGAGGESSSLDEDSSDALSPDQLTNHDSPLSGLPHMSPPSEGPGPDMSPTQFLPQPPPPPRPPPLPLSGSESPLSKVCSSSVTSPTSRPAPAQSKAQTRSSSDRPPQRSKKAKDNKPKVKKLKYHQYIPPDQKADKERPPQMDSSYAKLLHQQQLFLQLQILSQQQQHYNYHTILPAPPKPQNEQPATPGPGPSPSRTIATTTTTPSTNQSAAVRPSQTPAGGAKPAALPPNLDEFKVAELKAELKLRGLTVSGTKNDLIERLRNYQEQSGSAAAKSLEPAARGEGGVALTLLHKASEAQPQQIVRFSSTSSSPPVSPSPSERSLAAMSPDEASCGADIFEMVSSPLTQLSLHPSPQAPSAPPPGAVKEEGPSSCTAAAPEPTISMETSMDKDQMLQEKDKQIEELTRMLRQKQQLVETLRSQLEQGKTVKEEDNQPPCVQTRAPTLIKASAIQPPTLPNGLLSATQSPTLPNGLLSATQSPTLPNGLLSATQSPTLPNGLLSATQSPTLPNGLVLRLKKEEPEEKMEEAQVKKASPPTQCSQETLLRLQQIHRLQVQQAEQKVQQAEQKVQQAEQKQQVNKPPDTKAPNSAAQKKDVQLLLRQQQIQQLIIQQTQQRHQLKVPSANQRAAMLTSANQRAALTSANQKVVTLTSANQRAALTSANQRAAALNSANQRAALSQQKKLKLQQKQTAPLSTQQVASLVINPQSGAQIHTQAISLDLLKTNGAPTLVTDSNGNHYLIALTSHHGDGTNGLSSLAKSNGRITLQRLQSSPGKLPSSDGETKEQPPAPTVTCPKKVQKAGLHLEVNAPPQLSQSVSAPPTLQPFFEDVSDGESIMSSLKENGVNAQQMDDLFDLLLKSGEIPGFRSNPDPTLAPLHSDPPSPNSPPSPLQPGGAGRLEDFLESTTGGPLLGGEPDAALTLIDDLHSQMLSTPSILDPPSPMDTSELRFSPPSGLDFDSMDWLDISMGGGGGSGAEREVGGAPLVSPQTPQSVFSTDFLDTSDLTLHWESCL